MADTNREYAELFENYGNLWANAFTEVQGKGWDLLPVKPKTMEERNKVFVDFAKKGYAVYTENRYGDYYIYVLKLPETEGRVSERYVSESLADVYREFTDLNRKYGRKWAEDFKKERGAGWQRVGTAENETKYEKMFVDYAKKGYKVYGSYPHGAVGRFYYIIFVKELTMPERLFPPATPEVLKEFEELSKKYGKKWAEDYRKDRGVGWEVINLYSESPTIAEDYKAEFVEYARTGFKVYAEYKLEDRLYNYYLYVKKLLEGEIPVVGEAQGGKPEEAVKLYEKYIHPWADDYARDKGQGWELLEVQPASFMQTMDLFVAYANRGYKVYSEYNYGKWNIYVKKRSEAEKEFTDLYAKCGRKWADDYARDKGQGWSIAVEHPATEEEFEKLFVDYVKKGYKVYAVPGYPVYTVYVKQLSEAEKLSKFSKISLEFIHLYGIYADKWAEDYRRDRGTGWQQLSGMAETEEKYGEIFVDYAKKGYKVYGRHPYGPAGYSLYIIYVKKLPESELPLVREANSELPDVLKQIKEWEDFVISLRGRGYNWKFIVEETIKKFYWVPEKDVVDYIIEKYIGRENLKKAIYKPERRIVFVAPVEGFLTQVPGIYEWYLVMGVGMRSFRDLSFDPVEISTLEKTGLYPPETTVHVDELKKIIREYRQGLVDAATAIDELSEIVERM